MTDGRPEVARTVAYQNVGTEEFLLTRTGATTSSRMNTRIQRRAPGDRDGEPESISSEQIKIAAENRWPSRQEDIQTSGHSIEWPGQNAEDPETFAPSPGKITTSTCPADPESGRHGRPPEATISPYYDSMIAKLITRGTTHGGSPASRRSR